MKVEKLLQILNEAIEDGRIYPDSEVSVDCYYELTITGERGGTLLDINLNDEP